MQSTHKKIAIFMSFSGDGGVERMMINLMQGLLKKNYAVDLVLAKASGSYIDMIPAQINIIRLGTSHTYTSLFGLIRFLKSSRPPVLLVAKHRAGIVAAWARCLGGFPERLVLRLGTNLSAALVGKGKSSHWLWYASMKLFYPRIDKIIAVSQGVADDIIKITGLPSEQIKVIHNPVITPELDRLAHEPVSHSWFQPGSLPVIMGIGRLTHQKDFPTLMQAFAKVRQQMPCHLVILGEGKGRSKHEALALELGISDSIDFPGFVANPYAFLSRSSLFVLSSRWEGSPNALTEALALGIPVVATDCPSGPREILQEGLVGKLVAVGDVDALVQAMLETIKHPLSTSELQSAVSSYTIEASTSKYIEALGI